MSSTPTFALIEMCQELEISDDDLKKTMKVFLKDLRYGLDERFVEKSSLKCYITYVQDFPIGNEKGKFLALDLASVNFRVIVINLSTKYFDLRAKMYTLPPNIISSNATEFFDYLAESIFQFTFENKINKDHLPLGFTFGFPLDQKSLSKGILKNWTKDFSCSNVEGRDVVTLLQTAIDRKKELYVDVVAVLNDTTGTLISCAWRNTNCKIGLIVGAGTNACFVERVERVKKRFDGDRGKPWVVINTESGAFGGGGQIDFLRTDWDRELDAETVNPGGNIAEKMVSSLYLGELVRRVLQTAAEKGFIFNGKVTQNLKTKGTFDTKFICDLSQDLPGQYRTARAVLNDLGYTTPSAQDCVDLRYTCNMAWRRAGRIVSAELAALLNYMGFPEVAIGMDGVLLRAHPGFSKLLNTTIRQLTRRAIKFQCMLSEDGGGLGAALVAAVAARERRKK